MPVYDRLVGDLMLLPADVAHTILELRSYVRDIELSAVTFASGKHQIDNSAHEYMRNRATLAANLIPKARDALVSVGGQPPVDWEVESLPPGTTLELAEPAFPNALRLED
jgi:hypothetical protein